MQDWKSCISRLAVYHGLMQDVVELEQYCLGFIDCKEAEDVWRKAEDRGGVDMSWWRIYLEVRWQQMKFEFTRRNRVRV